EVSETGHAKARLGNSAGNDAPVVGEIAVDIERDAVERDPVFDAHPDGGDLVLAPWPPFRAADPNPDAARAPFPGDSEPGKRVDDPFLKPGDESAHVGTTAFEVEHDIGHTLPWSMIRELAAPPGGMHRQPWLDELLRFCAGARGIKGGMFQQPDELGQGAVRDTGNPLVHGRERCAIRHEMTADLPLHRRCDRHCLRAQIVSVGDDAGHSILILQAARVYRRRRTGRATLVPARSICYILIIAPARGNSPAFIPAVVAELVDALA